MHFKCAYKLNLDYFDDLKKDLVDINARLLSGEEIQGALNYSSHVTGVGGKHYSGGLFVSHDAFKNCSYHSVDKISNQFNGSLLNVVRIHNLYPGEVYDWHRDGREGFNGVYGEEWGGSMYRGIPAGISILLSEYNEDKTEFAFSTQLRRDNQKFINDNNPKYYIDYEDDYRDELQIVDSMAVPDNYAVLNYLGISHRVVTKKQKPRVVAILPFWPTLQFEEVVHFCRSNNILIERE